MYCDLVGGSIYCIALTYQGNRCLEYVRTALVILRSDAARKHLPLLTNTDIVSLERYDERWRLGTPSTTREPGYYLSHASRTHVSSGNTGRSVAGSVRDQESRESCPAQLHAQQTEEGPRPGRSTARQTRRPGFASLCFVRTATLSDLAGCPRARTVRRAISASRAADFARSVMSASLTLLAAFVTRTSLGH